MPPAPPPTPPPPTPLPATPLPPTPRPPTIQPPDATSGTGVAAGGGTAGVGLHGAAYRALESVWSVPLVVSVQSRVALGHVGNSAAVPVLQWSGCEVADVPTTLLSNHPYYPGLRGRALPPETVGELLDGIAERGAGRTAAGVVSGYLGSPGTAEVVASFVETAREQNPGVRYICDPVMGDLEPGLYVDSGLPALFRDRLLPLADAITPNPFEAAWLSGHDVSTVDGIGHALDVLLASGPSVVVVTGTRLPDTPPDCLDTVLATAAGRWRVRAPFIDRHFDGTGDTFTAAFAGAWLTGVPAPAAVSRAVAVLAGVAAFTAAAGAKELQLVACRELIADPVPLPLLPLLLPPLETVD